MYFNQAQKGLLPACDEAPKSWDKLTKIRDAPLQGLQRNCAGREVRSSERT